MADVAIVTACERPKINATATPTTPTIAPIQNRVDRTSAIVTQIERLHAEHAAGEIDSEAYLAAKRDLLGVSTDDATP